MNSKKFPSFRMLVLIVLLVLGTASCTSTYVPGLEPPDTPTPAPADFHDPGVSPAAPSPDSSIRNSLPPIQFSEEQLELIASIDVCRKQGEKQRALLALHELIRSANASDVAFKQELDDLWWEIMADTTNIPQQPLTEAEVCDIAAVAYLVHPVRCFYDANTLPLEELFTPVFLWYSTDMCIPMYGRDGWEHSTPDYYPPDHSKDYGYVLTREQVQQFILDMLGVELPPFNDGDEYNDGNIRFHDGTFVVDGSDLIYHELLVSGYRYLGDGLYYVVLDGDDSGLPGPEEGHIGIIPNFMHLIVRRSDSKWGFTVVAKLHDAYKDTTLLKEGWTVPEDMTLLANTRRYPVQ